MDEKESFLIALNKLPFIKTLMVAVTIVECVGMPIVYLFLQNPESIKQYDIVKLLLITISF